MGYPSDLKEHQWDLIKHHFPSGNRAKHNKKSFVDSVFYVTKTGCQWRWLPSDFPPWQTVYSFYRRAKVKGIWEQINHDLVKKCRLKIGKKPEATFAIIDSQSVKTTDRAEKRGIDGGKKNQGT